MTPTPESICKKIEEESNGSWIDMITEGFEAGVKYASKEKGKRIEELEKEVERLKGLVEEQVIKRYPSDFSDKVWQRRDSRLLNIVWDLKTGRVFSVRETFEGIVPLPPDLEA